MAGGLRGSRGEDFQREIETQRESNRELPDGKLRDSVVVKERTSKREVERLGGVKRRAVRWP